jgi:hypothetical protein
MRWWWVSVGEDDSGEEEESNAFCKKEEEGIAYSFFTNAFSLFLTFSLVWWSSLIGGSSGPIEFHAGNSPTNRVNRIVKWSLIEHVIWGLDCKNMVSSSNRPKLARWCNW